MVKSEIRLKYSGLIVFATKLLSVGTGLVFILMITRTVSTDEFGIWGNVNDIFNYFILLASVLPFWATRFLAREHAGTARTGLIANVLLSIASASIYFVLLPTILSALRIGSAYTTMYTIVSLQIIELYTTSALESVLLVKQPQAIGYGLLINEVCKVILGFILIIQLKLGLQGAIYSLVIANFVQIAFYIRLTVDEFRENVRWIYLKEWLKASLINFYNIMGGRIAAFALILLFVYGEAARAYYGAALSFAGVITNSTFLAFALYPRLLSESNTKDISTSLKMVLTVAIPMTVGVIVLSDSYLTILNPAYTDAKLVLSILALSSLSMSLSGVFDTVVMGTEKIDAEAKIEFRQLVKSPLFQIFTLPYVKSAITLPTTFLVLLFITKTPLEAAVYLALISLITNSLTLLCRYIIARKRSTFTFPWKNVAKYLIASSVMAASLLAIPHPTRLLLTVGLTILGGIIYFTVLATIDHETKDLAESIFNEVKSMLHVP